ncbi:MAG: four helix bundle protein [Sedimentisphaerales bacterium]|nr:four helix bundle protein [Sedimentisphaerales bacterium]
MGKTHKDLDIWQLGIDLVEHVYQTTKAFPKDEEYGLKSQMRRAAVSYPSNLAEGAARSSTNEYVHFVYIALGSLSELETQLVIAGRLKYLDPAALLEEVEALRRKMLNFIKYMKSARDKGTTK